MTKYKVWYKCHKCSESFFVMQGIPELDEDISICFTCVDLLLVRSCPQCHGRCEDKSGDPCLYCGGEGEV